MFSCVALWSKNDVMHFNVLLTVQFMKQYSIGHATVNTRTFKNKILKNKSTAVFYLNFDLKGQAQCVLMQVVINKLVFFLNPEKILAQICLIVFEKNEKTTHTLISKNDTHKSSTLFLYGQTHLGLICLCLQDYKKVTLFPIIVFKNRLPFFTHTVLIF